MASIVTRWFPIAIVLLAAAVAAAITVRFWGTEARKAQRRLLLLAAALALVANSGGWGYAATVHLLVAMRAPWRMLKEVSSLDLGWLNVACWGCAVAAALTHGWRFRSRERRKSEGVSLWRYPVIAVAVVAASLALRYADDRGRDRGYFLTLDMHPATGTPARRSVPTTRPREVASPTGGQVAQLALGLITDDEGYERAWGCVGTSRDVWCFAPEESTPIAQEPLLHLPVAVLSVGRDYGCGVSPGGEMKCWGRSVPSALRAHTATDVQYLDAVGNSGPCLVVARRARCLVGGSLHETTAPDHITAISVGYYDGACVLTAASDVWCFRLRLDDEPGWTLIDGVSATKIVTAGSRGCAITQQRELVCWQQASTGITRIPISGVVDVALGDEHACAVTADGRSVCWGQNRWGQLGDGSTTPRPEPTEVVDIDGFRRVAAIGATTCAATRDDRIFCWGRRSDR